MYYVIVCLLSWIPIVCLCKLYVHKVFCYKVGTLSMNKVFGKRFTWLETTFHSYSLAREGNKIIAILCFKHIYACVPPFLMGNRWTNQTQEGRGSQCILGKHLMVSIDVPGSEPIYVVDIPSLFYSTTAFRTINFRDS